MNDGRASENELEADQGKITARRRLLKRLGAPIAWITPIKPNFAQIPSVNGLRTLGINAHQPGQGCRHPNQRYHYGIGL